MSHHHGHHHIGSSRLLSGYGPAQVVPLAPLPTEQAQRRMPREETPLDRAIEAAKIVRGQSSAQRGPEIKPLNFAARSANELRPMTFDGMVGQARLLSLFKRLVAAAKSSGRPLDHLLLVGSAGTGKTTTAQVIAHELGRPVYMLKAPIAQDVLEALATTAHRGDIVIVDECHLWTKPDRRGVNAAASPEQVYSILEDKRLQTATGVVAFPDVTFIGCTTSTGSLPEPFLARFPIQPHLDRYSLADMIELAKGNARALALDITPQGASVFAGASRGVPRQLNTYVRNARSLASSVIDQRLAVEIVVQLNSVSLDGLTADMQNMLRFLLRCERVKGNGEVVYQAGLNTIATALGKSRDSQIVALAIEPWLIEQGYVAVTPSGRCLTDAGVQRARAL